MHPAVRTLYKELLLAARQYPAGADVGMRKLKAAFLAKTEADLSDPATLQHHLDLGEFVLRELHALQRLHKYRYVVVFPFTLSRLLVYSFVIKK